MRVLFICPKQFGYLLDSFYYCRKAPEDVRIDYLCADDGLEKIALPNTDVEYIPPIRGFQAKRRQLLLLLLKAARALITRRYDVVFIHCLPYFTSCFLLGLLFPFRKPVCDFRTGAVTMDEARRRKINRRLRWVAKCFSHASVISGSLKRELRLPDKKTFILPLGTDIYDYPERDMTRLNLLYVGILDSRRIDDTLNGLILFRRKHPEADFRYDIVGGGSPETISRLEALIREPELRDRAVLRGYIHHKDIAEYWAKANVGVSYVPIVPCYACQPPTKTFEYLGIGIPVIATDTPENRNIVAPENGVLIGDTAEEFCRGVEAIWTRREAFSQEKIKRSVGRYTWDEICSLLWNRLREIAASHKKMPDFREMLKRVGCMRSTARFLRYAAARYVMERKFRSCRAAGVLAEVRLPREPGRSSFFGYYNISPFSFDNRLAVWGETFASGVRGSLEAPLDIVVCDLAAGRRDTVARTVAWNWQQGAMTQWLGNSSDTIVFNDYCPESDGYCSRIVNISTGAERQIAAPFYSWSHDGRFFLTLNFKRLKLMRPDYAYFNHRSDALPPDAEDGIWKVDAVTGAQRLLVSLEQLRSFQPVASMDGAMHKVNHIDISPDDHRFIFLHRWVGPAGRRMRLFSADAETGELFLLNGDIMTSHSCWCGRDRIISFCHTDEFGDAYAVFRDGTPERILLSPKLPHSDGHPSVSPDGKWVVADTYPGFARFSKLMLFRLAEPELITAGEFFQPLCFNGESRIDLHPKWDRKAEYIGIDSGHTGRRQFHIFRLDGLK